LSPALEKRLLQAVLALACLSPFWFGLKGMIEGPAMLAGVDPGRSAGDLVSHYRYLSGLFFGLGLVLLSCVPRIEARGRRLRWVAGAIMLGGLARLGGAAAGDAPSIGHQIALAAELGLTPLLVLWQARLARRLPD
jgi:hypothetical protein